MEKILREFNNHEEADRAARCDDDALSCLQRFEAFMQLMAPHYAASSGFQRIYRVDDFRERTVRDDWGLRIQPLSKSKSNRGH